MAKMIEERARHYLKNGEYDYLSVISLMMYPVKNRANILLEFSRIPGPREAFDAVAWDKIQGKRPRACRRDFITPGLKEICAARAYIKKK